MDLRVSRKGALAVFLVVSLNVSLVKYVIFYKRERFF